MQVIIAPAWCVSIILLVNNTVLFEHPKQWLTKNNVGRSEAASGRSLATVRLDDIAYIKQHALSELQRAVNRFTGNFQQPIKLDSATIHIPQIKFPQLGVNK